MKLKTISQAILMLGAIGVSHQAFAAEDVQKAEKIEITGSSIKRINKEGALPVQQIKREDIVRSGATSVAELIQKLPAMQGFTIADIAAGTNSGGRVSASIHDIGEEYTLVLLNGRRLAPQGSGSAVNLNAIPMSAVERVEVLTDGASALYGSDAIAGVVNFILKKNEQGGSTEATYSVPLEDGGKSWNANLTYGFGDLFEDGFNILASYRHDEQRQLKATDRDFAKTSYLPFSYNGNDYIFDRTSPASIPASVDVKYGTSSTVSFSPFSKANNGQCAPQTFPTNTNPNICGFDSTATIEIVPESKRDSLFTTGRLRLNDSITLFSDIALSRVDVTARIAPNTAPILFDKTSPLYATYIDPYLTAAQRNTFVSATAQYRAYDWGTRDSRTVTDSQHFVAGIEADIADWSLSSSLTWSRNKLEESYVGGYMLNNEFRALIAASAFDPFAAIGVGKHATAEQIANSTFKGLYRTASTTLRGIDTRASREVFSLPGGEASLGLGADYREYDYVQSPTDAVTSGSIYNIAKNAVANYDMQRANYGAFAELLMPVIQDLELSTAVRYDSISAIDNAVAKREIGERMDATTFKISARYQPTNALLLRASAGTGFKAPSMLAIGQPLVPNGFTARSWECPKVLIAENAGWCRGDTQQAAKQQYNSYSGGNENLKPEKSEQFTIGFRFEPSAKFSFGLDLWDVKIEDAISSVSESQAFGDAVKYRELFTTFQEASTGNTYWAFKSLSINIGKAHYRGLDWDTSGRAKTPFGTLTTSFNGTYMLTADYTLPGTNDQWTSNLGYYGVTSAVTSRVLGKLNATLQSGALSNSVTVNYRSGYTDAEFSVKNVATGKSAPLRMEIPSYTTVDWQGKYAINKTAEVRAGVKNVFNRNPPLSLRTSSGHQVGYDPRYADPMMRTVYLSGAYKF